MRGRLRPSTHEDAVFLARHLRPEDQRELWACGQEPLAALETGLAMSDECMTLDHYGEVICMFGVAPAMMDGVGIPWLLGTERLPKFWRNLMIDGRHTVDLWMEDYRALVNYTNTDAHRRWLEALGFAFTDHYPAFGPHSQPFWKFERHRPCAESSQES